MTFDKAEYWRNKEARKNLPKGTISTRIVCRRCKSGEGQLIKETFFCRNGCDQNKLWDRIVGFFKLGNWRVIYPDGERSIPMNRVAAEVYRDHFGGLLLRTKSPITHLGFKAKGPK